MPHPIIKYGTAERRVSSTAKDYVVLVHRINFLVGNPGSPAIPTQIGENGIMAPCRIASLFFHGLPIVLGVAFCRIGLLHWTNPEPFEAIVPAYLGAPSFWNLLCGALEIIFGIGLAIPNTRRRAAGLLFFLVIAMSLANLNMWINDLPFNGTKLSTTGHVIRWTIQGVLLSILYLYATHRGQGPRTPTTLD